MCADFEAKNEKLLGRLPPELWQKILDENVQQNDLLALAMTCRFFREKQKDLGKNTMTMSVGWLRESGKVAWQSLGWFRWVCDTFEILPGFRVGSKRVKGAVYEGHLLEYAVYQGSVEILRWLVEEKGWEMNGNPGWMAGKGGSVEVLAFLRGKGYELNEGACQGAATGGSLEALKFLRGLDPPCPWDELTCASAAVEGQIEVLKWLRAQDPPCPWDEQTCSWAAQRGRLDVLKWVRDQDPPCLWDWGTCASAANGGHLEVLKWLRAQDPPCPWDLRTCSNAAMNGHLEVLKFARSQSPPCPWSATLTSFIAAKNGHLEVLRWCKLQKDRPSVRNLPEDVVEVLRREGFFDGEG